MEDSNDLSEKIQTLQVIEQNLQSLLSQKQMFQGELNEILNALSELSSYSDNVYKILSGIMIKTNKAEVIKDLEEKKKIAQLKISSFEKQESLVSKRADELRKEIISTTNKKR